MSIAEALRARKLSGGAGDQEVGIADCRMPNERRGGPFDFAPFGKLRAGRASRRNLTKFDTLGVAGDLIGGRFDVASFVMLPSALLRAGRAGPSTGLRIDRRNLTEFDICRGSEGTGAGRPGPSTSLPSTSSGQAGRAELLKTSHRVYKTSHSAAGWVIFIV